MCVLPNATQSAAGWEPHPELPEEVMSVFAALYLIFLRKHIVNKREKLEFGSERRHRAAVVGLASLSYSEVGFGQDMSFSLS